MQIKLFFLPWVWHRKRSYIFSGSEPTMTWLLDLDLGFKVFELLRTLYIFKKKKKKDFSRESAFWALSKHKAW